MKTLKHSHDIFLCEYACGLYAVERINKSIGNTLYTGSMQECESYYNNLIGE
jgi:hypothetical protein